MAQIFLDDPVPQGFDKLLKPDLVLIAERLDLGIRPELRKRVFQRAIVNYMIEAQSWDYTELDLYPTIEDIAESKFHEVKLLELQIQNKKEQRDSLREERKFEQERPA